MARMSDIVIGGANDGGGVFRARTVVILIAVGVIAFVAAALVSAYAPDINPTSGSQAHALSNAATGYSGIVRLAKATGHEVRVIRDERDWGSDALLVVTPPTAATPMGDVLNRRAGLRTLVVLPKWATLRDGRHPGWVKRDGLLPAREPEGVLAPADKLKVRWAKSGGRPLKPMGWMPGEVTPSAPRPLQYFNGVGIEPLLIDDAGHIVLGKLHGDRQTYVLSDPDLINNIGMRKEGDAAAGLAMLDALDRIGAGIDFDVTLVGIGHQKSPLRLALDPPFLAMTLTALAAMLLAAWQAFARFGPAAQRTRAIAFGKRALVDNSAMLVRKAGRQWRMGPRYVAVIRDRAIRAFGVPARLRDGEVDDYLDKLAGRTRFSDLAAAADAADDNASLVTAAQALHDWQREKSR